MTTAKCKKSDRKHTPITSEAQQGFFGAELRRKREGKQTKTKMSEAELERHLHESAGKKLPKRKKRKGRVASRLASHGVQK